MPVLGASELIPGNLLDNGAHVFHVEHPDHAAPTDEVTDASAAINDALSAASTQRGGGTVLLGNRSYKATGIVIPAGVELRGTGWRSRLYSTTNAPIVQITGEDCGLSLLRISGNATASTNTSQVGTDVNAHWRLRLFRVLWDNCFSGFHALTTEGNQSTIVSQGGELLGCETLSCQVGLDLDTRAEYLRIIGGRHHSNAIAARVKGGNAQFIGGDYNRNTDAFQILAGSNDSHGKVVGCNINHNTGYGIKVVGIANGFVFDACSIYQSSILLDSSPHVVLRGGVLAPTAFTVQNGCVGCRVEDMMIDESYGLTYTIDVGSYVQWRNMRKLADATAYSFQANIVGGYFAGTPVAATIASGAAAAAIDMNGLTQATCRNLPQTLFSFWDAVNKRIINRNLAGGRVRVNATIIVTLAAGYTDASNIKVEIKNQAGTVLETMVRDQYATTTLRFRFNGIVEQNPGDSFGFVLTNSAGSNATIVAAGSSVVAEGL